MYEIETSHESQLNAGGVEHPNNTAFPTAQRKMEKQNFFTILNWFHSSSWSREKNKKNKWITSCHKDYSERERDCASIIKP